ncbi:hypothetical protein PMIN03_011788 [Paraphaeosphaeria minitans]
MANPPNPTKIKRALTVDFINQQLPKRHSLFATQAVQYDPKSGQYQAIGANISASLVNTETPNAPSSNNDIVPRPKWKNLNAMPFWNDIFEESRSQFKSTPEPKGRSRSRYDIRGKTDWHSVYDTLETARQKYETSGGSLRKVRRKIADRITPGAETARIGARTAPKDQVVTPIFGAVELILDAVETAARVRNSALAGFDGLVSIFSDVELFLKTIGFFISNEFARAGKAILGGELYQKDLIDRIGMIQAKSRELSQQAQNSHLFESHMYYQESKKVQAQIDANISSVAHGAVYRDHQLDVIMRGHNDIKRLLYGLLQQKDLEIKEAQKKSEMLRSTSLTQSSMRLPPQEPTQGPIPSWCINQETLRNIINVHDLHLSDLAFVQDRKEQPPSRDRSRAEQITNTQLFRSWIQNPSSTKLLVHWSSHLPKMIAEVTPLTHIDAQEFGARSGGQMMIGSLLDQLLDQWEFNIEPMHERIGYESLMKQDIEALTGLLGVLVRQIPPEMDALPVFLSLIQLIADDRVRATVKLLITSTPGTDILRGPFEEEDLILNVDSLPVLVAASEERMVRELEGGLYDDVL